MSDLLYFRGLRGAPAQGVPYEPNDSTPMQAGVTPLECWYSGVVNQAIFGTTVGTVDQLRAWPFIVGRSALLGALGFEVTTGVATAVGRVGIYSSGANGAPSSRVVDSGEFDCSVAGAKVATLGSPVHLAEGKYWFASFFGTAAPTVRAPGLGSRAPMLGAALTIGGTPIFCVLVATAYGALPSAFPGGGALQNSGNGTPIVSLSYAA